MTFAFLEIFHYLIDTEWMILQTHSNVVPFNNEKRLQIYSGALNANSNLPSFSWMCHAFQKQKGALARHNCTFSERASVMVIDIVKKIRGATHTRAHIQ